MYLQPDDPNITCNELIINFSPKRPRHDPRRRLSNGESQLYLETTADRNANLKTAASRFEEFDAPTNKVKRPRLASPGKLEPISEDLTANTSSITSSSSSVSQPKPFRIVGPFPNAEYLANIQKKINEYKEKFEDLLQFNARLEEFIVENAQTQDDLTRKLEVLKCLQPFLVDIFSKDYELRVLPFGSSMNGCSTRSSDLDVTIVLKGIYDQEIHGDCGVAYRKYDTDSNSAKLRLRKINERLNEPDAKKFITKIDKVETTRVPIIKLQMSEEFHHLEIDLNVNNFYGVYNTLLLRHYAEIDERFSKLGILVKRWATRAGINKTIDGYLSNYTYLLLVIHYLQCGVTPPILPNLLKFFPEKYKKTPKSGIQTIDVFEKFAEILPEMSENSLTLVELFTGFIYYYAEFPWESIMIVVGAAATFRRNGLLNMDPSPIHVRDPLNDENTAQRLAKSGKYDTIVSAFRNASQRLSEKSPTNFFDWLFTS